MEESVNNGVVDFNGERFSADRLEYFTSDKDLVDELGIDEEEQNEVVNYKPTHWVTVHTDNWLDDCGDILCSAARELVLTSNEFDLVGNFSLEAVAKEKGENMFVYMFRSFGDVEFVNKGAF